MNKNPDGGKADLKLAPCASAAGLKEPGGLADLSIQTSQVDEAFGEAMDQQVAQLFKS